MLSCWRPTSRHIQQVCCLFAVTTHFRLFLVLSFSLLSFTPLTLSSHPLILLSHLLFDTSFFHPTAFPLTSWPLLPSPFMESQSQGLTMMHRWMDPMGGATKVQAGGIDGQAGA